MTTSLAHPKMIVFLLYSEAQQRKSRGLEGKEEGGGGGKRRRGDGELGQEMQKYKHRHKDGRNNVHFSCL